MLDDLVDWLNTPLTLTTGRLLLSLALSTCIGILIFDLCDTSRRTPRPLATLLGMATMAVAAVVMIWAILV